MSTRTPQLILASQSMARRKMLEHAGLRFSMIPANFDEQVIIDHLQEQKMASSGIALELSQKKALKVAEKQPETLVIGSDQVLEFEGKILSKAKNEEEAREKLEVLKGKTHKLISAVSVATSNGVLWQHVDEAVLTMKDFDEDFLDEYCARAGEALTRAVGAYEIESHGAWLFSSVKGDYFTIMGLPLLPLLGHLEEHGFSP